METIAVLICADDWEGLYVNGELIAEDLNLNDPIRWINWTNEYCIKNLEIKEITEEDYNDLADKGNFPNLITDLHGSY